MANPTLTFYHANARGTGSVCRLQLNPAKEGDDGYILLEIAPQKSSGICPSFDWGNSVIIPLDFSDLCKMLQVFRGECESIDDGRGLFHRNKDCMSRVFLRHVLEPIYGYHLNVTNKDGDAPEKNYSIFFNNSEALGLCESIASSLYLIAFGRPNVCE